MLFYSTETSTQHIPILGSFHVIPFTAFDLVLVMLPFLGTKHFQQKWDYFFFSSILLWRLFFQDERRSGNFLYNPVRVFYG